MTRLGESKRQLLNAYFAALHAVDGVRSVVSYFETSPPVETQCYVVAIGKAAMSMMFGARAALGERIAQSIVITSREYIASGTVLPPSIHLVEANHPVPDVESLAAGEQLLAFLDSIPTDARVVFLISGGTSSMVEVLPPTVSLEQLKRLNHWLLESGLAIDEVNYLRKKFSRIKGGRLIDHVVGKRVLALYMSDVPGNDLTILGSGLLVRSPAEPSPVLGAVPAWLQTMIDQHACNVTGGTELAADIAHHVVSNLAVAMHAASKFAVDQGFEVIVHETPLAGDAIETAACLVAHIRQTPGVVHFWGGECTVRLPPNPGVGGRNCAMALAAAQHLANGEPGCFLALGTDGRDGNSPFAGAIVDSDSIAKGIQQGLLAQDYLDGADAATFLKRVGDAVSVAPTGVNVADLVMGIVWN